MGSTTARRKRGTDLFFYAHAGEVSCGQRGEQRATPQARGGGSDMDAGAGVGGWGGLMFFFVDAVDASFRNVAAVVVLS